MPSRKSTFSSLLALAIKDFADHGYDSIERLDLWKARLRDAANAELLSERVLEMRLRKSLGAIYDRMVQKRAILKYHPGVEKYTLDMIRPDLRAELSRRISASADLIRVHREEAIEKTLQRFSGWASSVPPGGSSTVEKVKIKSNVGKALRQMDYEGRRLYIDQGHKLVSNISAIVAEQSGAIAGLWRSHWRQAGYDYREDHKERDGKVYAIRGSWAIEQGFMKKGPNGYLDEHEAAGFLPYCRCWIEYKVSLPALPPELLTRKGKAAVSGKKEE